MGMSVVISVASRDANGSTVIKQVIKGEECCDQPATTTTPHPLTPAWRRAAGRRPGPHPTFEG